MEVLKLLSEEGDAAFDTMCLLRTLGQVRTDMVDRKRSQTVDGKSQLTRTEINSEQKGKRFIGHFSEIRPIHNNTKA